LCESTLLQNLVITESGNGFTDSGKQFLKFNLRNNDALFAMRSYVAEGEFFYSGATLALWIGIKRIKFRIYLKDNKL